MARVDDRCDRRIKPGNKLGGCHDAGGNRIAANVMVAGPELTSGALSKISLGASEERLRSGTYEAEDM